jgi:hypothetical protein
MPRKLAIVAIVIAIFGLVAALMLMQKPGAKTPTGQGTTKQNAPIIQTGTVPSLSIDSPQPAGDRVTVAKVTLPIHGFVVIRDAASNSIVGASNIIIFPETRDMKIAATVVVGKTYIAEIHADGDNNGLFDAALDPPFIISGKTVTATFKVK